MSKDQFIRMPLSELTTPKGGRICMADMWWAVTDDGYALFFKAYYWPQCNAVKAIVERIRPDCKAVFVPFAYVPHNCSDYC